MNRASAERRLKRSGAWWIPTGAEARRLKPEADGRLTGVSGRCSNPSAAAAVCLLYRSVVRLERECAVREGIHPEYFDVDVRCACGATWKTRSTKKELRLEICSNCHPFFTGKQKLIDTEGRVERFMKKHGAQTVARLKERQKQLSKTSTSTPSV